MLHYTTLPYPILCQAAFVDQQLGDSDAASTAYKQLFSFKTDLDPAVAAVAANNIVALRGGVYTTLHYATLHYTTLRNTTLRRQYCRPARRRVV